MAETTQQPGARERVQTLEAAIGAKDTEGAGLRAAYSAAVDRLAADPGDEQALADLPRIETALARTTAARNALDLALDQAREQALKEDEAARLAAIADATSEMMAAHDARLKDHKALDQAADAFVAAVQKFVAGGEALGEVAHRLAKIRDPHAGHLWRAAGDLASGASASGALSLVIAKITDAWPNHLRGYLAFSELVDVRKQGSFTQQHAEAGKHLRGRFAR